MSTPFGQVDSVAAARIRAAARQLADIHRALREDLKRVRVAAQAYADGAGGEPLALPNRLAEHCVAFCEALHAHHTGEDSLAFPYLDATVPELRPVLSRLRQEHVVVADHLRTLRGLLDIGHTDPGALLGRLDRLTADLDEHFRYEEEQLVPALRALDA
ncbi:hemerythrin domain-containing protein [Hamadaea sp. NPDC051192]|uniref:hemerythrin domain-containing protein n=1 Tax=Hamadaea sp. NPDC051192 TaxID=3154940 RepID=UPI00344A036A